MLMLAQATHNVGDPQVRHRGTIGGAVAYGILHRYSGLLALKATVVVRGPEGEQEIV